MRRLPLLLAALLVSWPASAQLPKEVGPRARASLLTVTPGDPLYALFGHSAVRVEDPASGLDVVFSFGTFDTSDPWFIPKFIQGIMWYRLSANSTRLLLLGAEYERRGVVERRLAMDPEQVARLYGQLVENLLSENASYRYDFFFDNCSTRVRDLVERVASPTWRADPARGLTLRELLAPYLRHRAWMHAGVDLLLGSVTDRRASARESVFLPDALDEAFAAATVTDDSVSTRSLVAGTDTLLWYAERETRDAAFPWPAATGWLLFAIGALGAARSRFRTDSIGIWDRMLLGTVGTVGVAIWYLTLASDHAAMALNLNAAWTLPTHLAAGLWARRLPRHGLAAYFAVSAALGIAALFAGLFPGQSIPAALRPFVLLVVVRSVTLARGLSRRSG